MLKRSGSSVYGKMAQAVASATEKSYEKGEGSPPSMVAKVISQALKSKKPKTRYAVGKFAKQLIFIRKWFGDRIFDQMIQKIIGN